jgi:hypothetical protein
MEIIAHDDVADQLPALADDRVLEAHDQPTSVRVIADNLLPSVAPSHHVIDRALKFDPQSPWHVQSNDTGETDFQAENQKQSLSP